jgi:hypothetical protein
MTKTSFRLRTIAMAVAAVAITAGAMAGPALADDWGHRGREVHEHWRPAPHRVVYARPPVYTYRFAAPAPVYAPPVAVAPPVSFNLVLPLQFN